jgi:hypothetical protein
MRCFEFAVTPLPESPSLCSLTHSKLKFFSLRSITLRNFLFLSAVLLAGCVGQTSVVPEPTSIDGADWEGRSFAVDPSSGAPRPASETGLALGADGVPRNYEQVGRTFIIDGNVETADFYPLTFGYFVRGTGDFLNLSDYGPDYTIIERYPPGSGVTQILVSGFETPPENLPTSANYSGTLRLFDSTSQMSVDMNVDFARGTFSGDVGPRFPSTSTMNDGAITGFADRGRLSGDVTYVEGDAYFTSGGPPDFRFIGVFEGVAYGWDGQRILGAVAGDVDGTQVVSEPVLGYLKVDNF